MCVCRWVISFGTGEGEVALRRLSRALFEAAAAFYSDDARRRLAVHAERRNPAPAVSVRTAFKVRSHSLPDLYQASTSTKNLISSIQALSRTHTSLGNCEQHPIKRPHDFQPMPIMEQA